MVGKIKYKFYKDKLTELVDLTIPQDAHCALVDQTVEETLTLIYSPVILTDLLILNHNPNILKGHYTDRDNKNHTCP